MLKVGTTPVEIVDVVVIKLNACAFSMYETLAKRAASLNFQQHL